MTPFSRRSTPFSLRTVYVLQLQDRPSLTGAVDVRFIFCNVTSAVGTVLVALEIMRYVDVMVLDCAENMYGGKTYDFFAGKAKNRYDGAPRMYNYVGNSPANCFRRGFRPDTIAVHMLKDAGRWAETLVYFNATAGLPSSGLHHLP